MIRIILFVSALIFFSCSKSIELPYAGSINGLDLALCACCGDYIITIKDDESAYRFLSLPEGTNINLDNDTLPIAVKFDYEFISVCSDITRIQITEIEIE